MRAQSIIISLLGAGVAVASRCKPSLPATSSTVSISSILTVTIASSSIQPASPLSSSVAPSSSPAPSSSSSVPSSISSSIPSSISSAPAAASSSAIPCTNLLTTPNFSPAGDWSGYGSGQNPHLDVLDPCDDRASCYKVNMTSMSTLHLFQTIDFPKTGTYTASLEYKVLSVSSGATFSFELDGEAIVGEPLLLFSEAPLDEWQTVTFEFTTSATDNGGPGRFGFTVFSPALSAVSVLFTDAELIPCHVDGPASASSTSALPSVVPTILTVVPP